MAFTHQNINTELTFLFPLYIFSTFF